MVSLMLEIFSKNFQRHISYCCPWLYWVGSGLEDDQLAYLAWSHALLILFFIVVSINGCLRDFFNLAFVFLLAHVVCISWNFISSEKKAPELFVGICKCTCQVFKAKVRVVLLYHFKETVLELSWVDS